MSRNTRTTRVALAALFATSLVLAACGDDEGDDEAAAVDTTAEESTTTADAAETTSEPAAGGDVVEVHTVDYAFEQLPESVPAGTRLTLVNDSSGELHELIALRIPDTEARSVEELVALPEEEVDALFADVMPATVLLTPPDGEQVDALGDGTLSEPGRYAVVCFIPTGVDPEEYLSAPPSEEGPPEIPGAGPPHVEHGMYAELLVE